MDMYLDGRKVAPPALTPLEKRLAACLAREEFGDSDHLPVITSRPDEWCGEGGFTRVELIEWPDRRQLGALLVSLQRKRLVVMDQDETIEFVGNRPVRRPTTEVWFDCEVLEALARA